jgi:hypothetical protein
MVVLIMLCLTMPITSCSFSIGTSTSENDGSVFSNESGVCEIILDDSTNINLYQSLTVDDFGVWFYSIYDGSSDEVKLDIDMTTFKLMLDGGGWRYYQISLQENNDTRIGLQFVRTQIYLIDEATFVDVVQTHYTMETTADTTYEYSMFLEVRFPFSLLKIKGKSVDNPLLDVFQHSLRFFDTPGFERLYDSLNRIISQLEMISPRSRAENFGQITTSEPYFSLRFGFTSPENDEGPHHVETRFFFGRNSICDPRVFRFKVTPYELERDYSLVYNASFLTVDGSLSEAFFRSFSIGFEPAAELQITTIPGKGKISYDFGNSGGRATTISFSAVGGSLSNIVQRFMIDPLPSYMTFDLTILGERSFLYESDTTYDVTYMVDDVQEGNLVAMSLTQLPQRIKATWGLAIRLLSLSAEGLIDLDMSSDIAQASISLFDSEEPFMQIDHFPQKLRVDAGLDVPSLNGYVQASKYSGATTTLTVPLRFNKWQITGVLELYDGYGLASFDLPSQNNTFVSVGLDTGGDRLFGVTLTVVDIDTSTEVLSLGVGAIATDDLLISFNYDGDHVENLAFSGGITELIDLVVSLSYQGADFDIAATWTVGEAGSFELSLNKPVEVTFADIENEQFKLNGFVSLNDESYLKIEWEWGQTGYFMVYTREPIGEELHFEIGYGANQNGVHQYGLNVTGTDFLDIKRTVMWDTENGIIPRIWVLGDNPFPGEWDVWLLWNYEWYEVK